MDSEYLPLFIAGAVVPLNDDCRLSAEVLHPRLSCGHSQFFSKVQAEVFVDLEAVEVGLGGRLEDVRGWCSSAGNPPSTTVMEQGCLRLGPGEAELASLCGYASRSVAFNKIAQEIGDLFFAQPIDIVG